MKTENIHDTAIKYLDLKAINAPYEEEIKEETSKVASSGWYLQGENVNRFERGYAAFIGTHCSISCGNGLDALKLILMGEMALGKLQKGDEVIVPANTYIATILAIISVGLSPILVEPNPETLQIDENLIEAHLSSKTKAVMLVHLYGKLAWTKRIQELCHAKGLLLFEDNAQAFGCGYLDKYGSIKHTGALSDAAAHSFYPSKNLGAWGDAGAVTTNDEELAEVIKGMHNYGSKKKYEFEFQGINSRMDEIQAAVLNVKLRHPHKEHEARWKRVQLYLATLHPDIVERCIPKRLFENSLENVVHIFPFLTTEREQLREWLAAHHIETAMHYPIPPNKQKGYPELQHLHLPITEAIAEKELSLPCNSTISKADTIRIAQLINEFYDQRRSFAS